jgi:hypothetical protein
MPCERLSTVGESATLLRPMDRHRLTQVCSQRLLP